MGEEKREWERGEVMKIRRKKKRKKKRRRKHLKVQWRKEREK